MATEGEWTEIEAALTEVLGEDFEHASRMPVAGGCIHESWLLKPRGGSAPAVFLKLNRASAAAMFRAEARALQVLTATGAVRVPCPLAEGIAQERAWLALEALELGPANTAASQQAMGRALADLHRNFEPEGRYGWPEDNWIGESPQLNGWDKNWVAFFRAKRLGWQLNEAEKRGRGIHGAERLLEGLDTFFVDHEPEPSLLHGDLWGGNAAFSQGEPVLYDPASYYGDRETDLAFTRLFGGFSSSFYTAYETAWPLAPGSAQRIDLYNLYHILNHDRLFGGSYGSQAQRLVAHLVARM